MKKQKKQEPNTELKSLFEEFKKSTGVRSVDVAFELNVSPQTVTAMSGNLDECKLSDVAKIADLFKVNRADFISAVLRRSKIVNNQTPKSN